jgi:hypothetical protein
VSAAIDCTSGAFWDNIWEMYGKLEPEVHAVHICGDEAAFVLTMSARTGDGGSAIDGVDISNSAPTAGSPPCRPTGTRRR